MQRLYERIAYLEQQLSALVADYQQQRVAAQKLQQENTDLKHKLATQVTHDATAADLIKGMCHKYRGEETEGDLRHLIESCLQYIDQCIAFLESYA